MTKRDYYEGLEAAPIPWVPTRSKNLIASWRLCNIPTATAVDKRPEERFKEAAEAYEGLERP